MIKVHFYNYGHGTLDIENELEITEEVEDFLIENIPGLELECTDSAYDMDDNYILWFSANDEVKCMQKIQDVLKSRISTQSRMQYKVIITSDFSWND